MGNKEIQAEIIHLLIKNEVAVSELYAQYATLFPEYEDFWRRLSKEEIDHAEWIKVLSEKITGDRIFFNESRFRKQAIQLSVDSIINEFSIAKQKSITLKQAVTTALNIENALLESKYFTVIEGDSPELKSLLKSLSAATIDHRERLKRLSGEITGR